MHGDVRSELPRRLLRWSGFDAADLPAEQAAEQIGRVVLQWEERDREKARA